MHDFGVVTEHGDHFEFFIDTAAGAHCRLVATVQTERGPQRTDLAGIPGAIWRKISVRVVRELAVGMGESERAKAAPKLKTGTNRLSPLIGRELALLLWTLQEEGATEQLEAILHGWRELAREERWWLYAKAAVPGQRTGIGWRRALFHALAEAAESRAALPTTEKKSPLQAESSRLSGRQRLNNQTPAARTTTNKPPRSVARKRKTAAVATNPS
jgi:hypothetical protein